MIREDAHGGLSHEATRLSRETKRDQARRAAQTWRMQVSSA